MRAILTYHSIDPSGSPISVSPEDFRRHVQWLASGRVRVLSLADLVADQGSEDAVALTFDDGFANFGETAVPLLRAYALPATVFVVSDHVGGTNEWEGIAAPGIPILPLLDWQSLGRLAEQGIELGAHTRRHRALPTLPADQIDDEVGGGIAVMRRELGSAPRSFAYPYGAVDEASAAVVRRTVSLACTTVLRELRADDDPAQLPRLDMFYLRRAGRLESWGTQAFTRHLWLRAQARRVRQAVVSARAGR